MKVWLEIIPSMLLMGTGVFVFSRGPSKLSGRGASWGEVRDLAVLVFLCGLLGVGVTVGIFLRGAK